MAADKQGVGRRALRGELDHVAADSPRYSVPHRPPHGVTGLPDRERGGVGRRGPRNERFAEKVREGACKTCISTFQGFLRMMAPRRLGRGAELIVRRG